MSVISNTPATANQCVYQPAPQDLEKYNWDMWQSTGDKSYLDNYMDIVSNRQNTTSAYDRYEQLSNTQYQRAVEDLKKAGLNPWLAISHLNGAGAGSVSAATGSSSSVRANEINSLKSNADVLKANADVLKVTLGALGSLAMMLIMLA